MRMFTGFMKDIVTDGRVAALPINLSLVMMRKVRKENDF